MWSRIAMILVLLSSFYFFVNSLFITEHPPIWPDEAEYADVAYNINNEGRMYSKLSYEVGHNDANIYWYPPLIFYLYAGIFKLFGFSIFTLRWFMVIIGFLFLSLLYLFSKRLIKDDNWLIFSPLVLLLLDPIFMKAVKIGRPETMVLFLSLGSLFLITNFDRSLIYFFSGVLVGLAILFHTYAMATFIIILVLLFSQYRFDCWKRVLVFLFPVALLLFWWFYAINFSFKHWFESAYLQALRKILEPGYFRHIFNYSDFWYALLNLNLLLGSVFIIIYLLIKPTINQRIIIIAPLIIYWLVVFSGKQFWYFVYPIPFLYLGYSIILKNELNQKGKNRGIYFICFFIFIGTLIGLKMNYQNLYMFNQNNFSYTLFAKSISEQIPNSSFVFISSIPDPYFELKKNKTLELRHFIALPGYKKEYLETLNKSDYVVYTGPLDLVYGDLLSNYLKSNTELFTTINNGPNQYQALIIKLKPTKQRKFE